MTSAQLILVSVSSALIAVIAMLVVATVLRARTRESPGGDVAQPTGPQTRAQRAAARAQKRAQRATTKADRKAAKDKAEKDKAAALETAKTKADDDKSSDKEKAAVVAKSDETKGSEPGAPKGESSPEEGPLTSATDANETPGVAGETDVLAVPEKKEDDVATTEAGRKASEAKPKARKSLLERAQADDASEEKS